MTNLSISGEDFIDSIKDKVFIKKMAIFVLLTLLFVSMGYLLAKEKGMRNGYEFSNRVIQEYCSFNLTYTEYQSNIDYYEINDILKNLSYKQKQQ